MLHDTKLTVIVGFRVWHVGSVSILGVEGRWFESNHSVQDVRHNYAGLSITILENLIFCKIVIYRV